jgi:5-methylcytosine-specific restriction endonuclease McrA
MAFATNFKSDSSTRLTDRTAEKRAEDKHWHDVCRAVDARDGMRCRACGRKVVRTLARQVDRLEHHHVIPRSLGGQDEAKNVANICLECHDDRHVTRTLEIRGNANSKLTFKQNGKTWRG